jgi:hypothetical protein
MNERIKELYRQAHMVREYPEDDPMRGGNPPTVYWGGERSAERFAELIVRECMTQIQQVREIKAGHAGPEYTHGFDDGMFVAIRTIEEHFGVEE